MAHFIGKLQGARGEASRLGTKSTGMVAKARGWEIGGEVRAEYDATNQLDRVSLSIDGGSNGGMGSRELVRASYSHVTGKVYVEVLVNGAWKGQEVTR